MSLDNKTCLICDDAAVIEVISLAMQAAALCGVHWVDFCSGETSMTADEVNRFFDDGLHGDVAKSAPEIYEQNKAAHKTDETPGDYRTDEQ